MDDLNACAECGYTTKNFDQFRCHVQRHEEDVAITAAANLMTKNASTLENVESNSKKSESSEQNNNTRANELDNSNKSFPQISSIIDLRETSIPLKKLEENNLQLSNTTYALNFSMDETSNQRVNTTSNTIVLTNGNTTTASNIIENARMLASIADFSRFFNKTATTNELNNIINARQTALVKPENADPNLRLDLINSTSRSPLNASANQLSLNLNSGIEEFAQSSTSPSSLTSSLEHVVQNGINSSTGNARASTNSTTERSRSTKTRKECPHCNFTTYMSQHMKSHLEAHERHRGQMYQCDICHTEFSQKANMHRHRTRHSGIKPYRCRFCHKEFFRKDQMQEHSMTHIKTGDDFDCPVAQCQKQFNQHQALRQHLDEDHIINASQQACCKRCALLFSNSRRLLLHYQTKHDDFQKLGTVKPTIKTENTSSSNLMGLEENSGLTASSTIQGAPCPTSLNVLAEMANNKEESVEKVNNHHLAMLAAAASISSRRNNFSEPFFSISSKRRAQRSNSNSVTKRVKSGSVSPLNVLNTVSNEGYKVEELLKNRKYLSPIDSYSLLSSISPTSLESNVNITDSTTSPASTVSNIRFIDDIMSKAIEEANITSNKITEDETICDGNLKNKSSGFRNIFNNNTALITSIALARKAFENKFVTAAATLASSTNSSFEPFLSSSFASAKKDKVCSNLFTSVNSSIQNTCTINSRADYNTANNKEYLPRSKSPDYQNLILNGYKMTNNELLIKIAGNIHKSSLSQNETKPSLHHHLQLWTNEANSATTTTLSFASSNDNAEDDEHINTDDKPKPEVNNAEEGSFLLNTNTNNANHHSATHSPTASSSSSSSLGINNEERSPLPNIDVERLVKKNSVNIIPEKSTASLLLSVVENSDQKNGTCSPNASPSGVSSIIDSNSNTAEIHANSLILLNAAQTITSGREAMECLHCGILFSDQTLYLLHKGLHSESDAWRCNLCGNICSDKYTFTTHLISSDHS